jgi:hypothetical protein
MRRPDAANQERRQAHAEKPTTELATLAPTTEAARRRAMRITTGQTRPRAAKARYVLLTRSGWLPRSSLVHEAIRGFRSFECGCAVLLLTAASACSSNSAPTTPSTSTPSSVSVNCLTTTLTTVGQQTQCTAVAVLSNGTSQDETLASQWSSTNASVASVTATGMVTAVANGSVTITAIFQGVQGARAVSVNAPTVVATFILNGLLTDGTSGGILPNIDVQIISGPNQGQTTKTDATGHYSIGGLAAGTANIVFSAVSYVTQTVFATITSNTTLNIVLQRTSSSPTPPPTTAIVIFQIDQASCGTANNDPIVNLLVDGAFGGTLVNGTQSSVADTVSIGTHTFQATGPRGTSFGPVSEIITAAGARFLVTCTS